MFYHISETNCPEHQIISNCSLCGDDRFLVYIGDPNTYICASDSGHKTITIQLSSMYSKVW